MLAAALYHCSKRASIDAEAREGGGFENRGKF
jgi:hypothetical protein